jgi:16S rRNA (cytosine967-C5)-methyltransferase
LARVLTHGQALDEVIEEVARLEKLNSEQRGWLLEVCAGTLRWKGRLELLLDQLCAKKKPTGDLRRALLIGAYQLVAQERTSPGAVVNETVEFVKSREGVAPSKFVNAILRRVAETAAEWRTTPFRKEFSPAEQAAWASLPEWFWKKLVHDHGLEWAVAFAEASLERPNLWVNVKPGEKLGVAEEDIQLSPELAGAAQVRARAAVDQWPGFGEGKFFVQDVSSQKLVLEAMKEISPDTSSASQVTAWDVCAAPGGKSIAMAWLGARVTATDANDRRLPMLRENVLRTAKDQISVTDLKSVQVGEQEFDLVWIDAPCSGSGIIRRHPDVRWLRKSEEVKALEKTQLDIIQQAWGHVRKGGCLAYTVCSVFKEEAFESRMPAALKGQFEVVRTWDLAPHLAPHGDGFQGVLIRKKT